MLSNKLQSILIDLNKHKRDREELLFYYVEEKLNKSLETYSKNLDSSKKYLQNKKAIYVAKKLGENENE